MAKSQQQKILLGMAGEFGVASELMKRGKIANVTYGNAKAVDIIVQIPNTQIVKHVEVKTTRANRFVTGFFQKFPSPNSPHPDFWVLVHIDQLNNSHFYVLTHQEMANLQMERNKMTKWAPKPNGVDNVLISQLTKQHVNYLNNWGKIK